MTTIHFERAVAIDAPRARVFAELSDPLRFLGLQPLLTEIRELEARPGVRAFEAVERVRLIGPIAMRSRLRVELTPSAAQDRIGFATRAALGIRLDGAFALAEDGAHTSVRESVALVYPSLVAPFVRNQAMRAQEALLANLKRRLETRER